MSVRVPAVTVATDIRILGSSDGAVLLHVAPDVFDDHLKPALTAEFLRDPRHHLAVAVEEGMVVGFASGVHYVHPDKPSEMWINEVGVAPTHQGRGLGRAVVRALLEHAKRLGCREAWVLTRSVEFRSDAPLCIGRRRRIARRARDVRFRPGSLTGPGARGGT